jgi:hypothetical protein
MNMKKGYLIFIIILLLIFLVFECVVLFSPLGRYSRLGEAVQSAGIFVALLAAVIALSGSNPKGRTTNVNIEQFVDKSSIETYKKECLSPELKNVYQNSPDPVESYKVQFKITNASGFTLIKPTLTFRLPIQKQHPQKLLNRGPKSKLFEKMSKRTFHSNLFNSQSEIRVLEFGDTRILSNSNLPYWNDQDDITIWIKMVLDGGNSEPFYVEVSVNCENAEGRTEKVKINPKGLLE